jgi:hypothetical protein
MYFGCISVTGYVQDEAIRVQLEISAANEKRIVLELKGRHDGAEDCQDKVGNTNLENLD